MDRNITKAIRMDCHRMMWPCYVGNGLYSLMTFLIPTLAAWLVGDMTDALLALNSSAIRQRLLPFFAAIVLEATVAEHIMVHTLDYYFIQISKFTLPVTVLVYGVVLLTLLLAGTLPFIFGAVILLLAALPLLRTAILGRLNARIAAGTRDYETQRAGEEEMLFQARCFYRANRLTGDCLDSFHGRFEDWLHCCGLSRHRAEAAKTVFEYLCSYGAALGTIFVGAILVLAGRMGVGSLMTGYLLLRRLF